jgi:ribonuclease HI
MLKGLHE